MSLPPGVNEWGMDESPKDWKTLLQMLFVLVCVSGGVLLVGGTNYILTGCAAGAVLCIPYYGRWKTEDSTRRVVMMAVAWPAVALLSWHIVLREERWRKERILEEVMGG